MVFVFGVSLLLAGYALVDWGHYAIQGKHVSLWYLISAQGAPVSTANATRGELTAQQATDAFLKAGEKTRAQLGTSDMRGRQ